MPTPNIPPGGAHCFSFPIRLSGRFSAVTLTAARHRLGGRHMLLGFSAVARAAAGAGAACTVDMKVGGVSLLAAPLAITADAPAQAVLRDLSASGGSAYPTIPDEAVLTVDLPAVNGDWDDIDITVTLARK